MTWGIGWLSLMKGGISQKRKKLIFVREPGFGAGNVRTIHFDKFAK